MRRGVAVAVSVALRFGRSSAGRSWRMTRDPGCVAAHASAYTNDSALVTLSRRGLEMTCNSSGA
jgi:hypothetical protein